MVERIPVVRLPNGEILSVADLPKPGVIRWTAARKQIIVHAVVHGLLTRDQAMEKYDLSEDEFSEWVERFRVYGRDGLKSTKTQTIRQPKR